MKKITERPLWAQNIVKYRKLAKLTQSKLAEKIGILDVTLRKYELGIRTPSFVTISKIAQILNVSPYDIMDTDNRPDERPEEVAYIDKQFALMTKYLPTDYEILDNGRDTGQSSDKIEIVFTGGNVPISASYEKTTLIMDISKIKEELQRQYDAELKEHLNKLYHQIVFSKNKLKK